MKLTIIDKVYVPVSLQIEDIPSKKTTVFMYDAYGNQIEPYWLKEETNKYLLSREELEKVISDAVEMARESIVIHKISEWETEKEFGYTEEQIINSII